MNDKTIDKGLKKIALMGNVSIGILTDENGNLYFDCFIPGGFVFGRGRLDPIAEKITRRFINKSIDDFNNDILSKFNMIYDEENIEEVETIKIPDESNEYIFICNSCSNEVRLCSEDYTFYFIGSCIRHNTDFNDIWTNFLNDNMTCCKSPDYVQNKSSKKVRIKVE